MRLTMMIALLTGALLLFAGCTTAGDRLNERYKAGNYDLFELTSYDPEHPPTAEQNAECMKKYGVNTELAILRNRAVILGYGVKGRKKTLLHCEMTIRTIPRRR
ncbi:MAG: hypothetical protein LBR29_01575 [Methylobacteriaceae bacterium]|jgi:hypothetical protein|nr:hypothetical protein [Methylobacteriaceae bacterium]